VARHRHCGHHGDSGCHLPGWLGVQHHFRRWVACMPTWRAGVPWAAVGGRRAAGGRAGSLGLFAGGSGVCLRQAGPGWAPPLVHEHVRRVGSHGMAASSGCAAGRRHWGVSRCCLGEAWCGGACRILRAGQPAKPLPCPPPQAWPTQPTLQALPTCLPTVSAPQHHEPAAWALFVGPPDQSACGRPTPESLSWRCAWQRAGLLTTPPLSCRYALRPHSRSSVAPVGHLCGASCVHHPLNRGWRDG